jgi:hypothetical protein
MFRRTVPTVAVAALLFASSPLNAQPGPTWNRKVEGLSVLPAPVTGAGADQFFDITIYASIEAADLSVPVDLSTELEIRVNGVPVHTETHTLTANPGTHADCAGLPCGGEPCICTPPPVVCECGPILISAGATTPLRPKDYIEVLLRPAPGAVPDSDESDDLHDLTFHGDPIFWERIISSVEIVPPPVGASLDSFFDIIVDICERANYSGGLDLSSTLELRVNDAPQLTIPVDLSDLTWSYCDPECSIPCVLNGTVQAGSCQQDQQGPIDCTCQLLPIQYGFPAVPLEPDDVITVILRPAPGALPELPGFGDEDEQTRPVCPWDCGGGDFIVGILDFLALLAQWGQVGAPCDFDGNGVGVTDFLELLAHWGPCFPQ